MGAALTLPPVAADAAGQEESLLQFVYQFPVAVFRMDAAGLIDLINPRAAALLQLLGLPLHPAQGWQLLEALDAGTALQVRGALDAPGVVAQKCRVQRLDPKGGQHHLALTAIIVNAGSCMVSIEEVTQLVEQERQLAQQRQNLAVVLETIQGYFVATLDTELRVLQGNRSIERMLGLGPEVAGRGWHELLAAAAPGAPAGSAAPVVPDLPAKAEEAREQGSAAFDAAYRGADGQPLWAETILAAVVDPGGQVGSYVAVARDVTARRQREIELKTQALTDPLTGLLNRRGLAVRFAPWLQPDEPPPPLCALALDIDFFKRINDRHGHDGGDAVLQQIGTVLMRQFRRSDLLARLGGEEFVVLLRDTPIDSALDLAERLRGHIEHLSLPWRDTAITLTTSVGVAACEDGDLDSLLREADKALYRAKGEGRNRVVCAGAPG